MCTLPLREEAKSLLAQFTKKGRRNWLAKPQATCIHTKPTGPPVLHNLHVSLNACRVTGRAKHWRSGSPNPDAQLSAPCCSVGLKREKMFVQLCQCCCSALDKPLVESRAPSRLGKLSQRWASGRQELRPFSANGQWLCFRGVLLCLLSKTVDKMINLYSFHRSLYTSVHKPIHSYSLPNVLCCTWSIE